MTEEIPLIVGKWYVLDNFSRDGKPTCGPFDSRELAEADRRQMPAIAKSGSTPARGPPRNPKPFRRPAESPAGFCGAFF